MQHTHKKEIKLHLGEGRLAAHDGVDGNAVPRKRNTRTQKKAMKLHLGEGRLAAHDGVGRREDVRKLLLERRALLSQQPELPREARRLRRGAEAPVDAAGGDEAARRRQRGAAVEQAPDRFGGVEQELDARADGCTSGRALQRKEMPMAAPRAGTIHV